MWPDNKRCAVGLSFDFDAETLWTRTMRQPFPGQLSAAASTEHGSGYRAFSSCSKNTASRRPSLCRAGRRTTTPGWFEQMHADGHEIGHHGYEHEFVANKGREAELEVLLRGTESLKRNYRPGTTVLSLSSRQYRSAYLLTYCSITIFCMTAGLVGDDSPYWLTTPQTKRQLLEVPL